MERNRIIKFRGKVKYNGNHIFSGDWIYGYYRSNENGNGFITETLDKMDNYIFDETEIDENTVGQYTGLKDKNGKEIYEGDIVQIYEKTKAEIKYGEYQESKCDEYDCTHYGYYLDYKHSDYCENTGIDLNDVSSMCEVIGNIYDNPELLEKYIREEEL